MMKAGALAVFTAIATAFFISYWFIATKPNSSLYNYWAIISVEFFVLVFWLATFALMASKVADYNKALGYVNGLLGGDGTPTGDGNGSGTGVICVAGYCVNPGNIGNKRSLAKRSTDTYSSTLYTALAFSVINL
jgi:hypothetical protein